MDIEDLEKYISKAFGPVLLVISPLFIILLGGDALKDIGTSSQATVKEWIFIIALGAFGLFLGIYMCRKEYGWFKKKEK